MLHVTIKLSNSRPLSMLIATFKRRALTCTVKLQLVTKLFKVLSPKGSF